MEYPGQRNGGDHFSRIEVAFLFSVEGFGEIGGSKINRVNSWLSVEVSQEDGPFAAPTLLKINFNMAP